LCYIDEFKHTYTKFRFISGIKRKGFVNIIIFIIIIFFSGNIDVWVGGILEDQLPGSKVGPLFQCLLVEQFKNIRIGDRYDIHGHLFDSVNFRFSMFS